MWRSILFVPVLSDRFIEKAPESGADAVVLDLEASIAEARKDEARAAVGAAVSRIRDAGMPVLVRINTLWRAAIADLEPVLLVGPDAVVIPDIRTPAQIEALDSMMTEIEIEAGVAATQVIALVESAEGIENVRAIAAASSRLTSIGFGVEDYLTDMGVAPDPDHLQASALVVARAARSAGKQAYALPGSLAELEDMAAFRQLTERGKALGSCGSFGVHPRQIEVINAVFTPSGADLDWARRVVDADAKAVEQGLGAVSLDGRMIDKPIVERARHLLAKADSN